MDEDGVDLPGVTAQAEALSGVFDDLERRSRAFGAALTGALTSGLRDGQGLEDVLRQVGVRLSDIALSAGLKPLEGLLSQAVSSVLSGPVTAFASGGVVSQPTYFAMGGATGLMGEAGPEAILPLARGADGSLGVAASGTAPVNVVFNVTATDAASFAKSEGQIAAMLARTVRRGQRGL